MPTPFEAAVVRDMVELFKDPQPVELLLSKQQAWQLASALQLVLRHPELATAANDTAQSIRQIALELFNQIATTPTLRQVAEMGWNPKHDQPRGSHWPAGRDRVEPLTPGTAPTPL